MNISPLTYPQTIQRIAFTGKQQVVLETEEIGEPDPGEVLVRTHYSLMSTGTENIVFNRLFDAGTHWDGWVKYPFHPGYASVGEIVAVGADVESLRPGQRVAYRQGHASHGLLKVSQCYPVPDGLPLEHAVWFPMAKIAYLGALAARHHLGDRVMVIGAGPIGQMSIRWATAAGASTIIAVDTAEKRLALAIAGGATTVIAQPINDAREAILSANNGRLPELVIDSTGSAPVFSAALGLAAHRGKLVLLGDTGQPSQQRLSPDVITRGLSIVGVHDGHNTDQWNDATIADLFFRMVGRGRFSLDGMNTNFFHPDNCEQAYLTANRERATTMGIVFDWRRDATSAEPTRSPDQTL